MIRSASSSSDSAALAAIPVLRTVSRLRLASCSITRGLTTPRSLTQLRQRFGEVAVIGLKQPGEWNIRSDGTY